MRYYFDLLDGDDQTRDDIGVECRTVDQARTQAVVSLMEMGRDWIPSDGAERHLALTVRNTVKPIMRIELAFRAASLTSDIPASSHLLSVSH